MLDENGTKGPCNKIAFAEYDANISKQMKIIIISE